jgi:hypothetical protein
MTATEAAMYDNLLSGGLRSKMGSLTHKDLPLSMFLETLDLGFATFFQYIKSCQRIINSQQPLFF